MTETQPLPGTSERIAALDGMRGVAILMVIFTHWIVGPSHDRLEAISPAFHQLLRQAPHGVDIFFVISGFLIGRIFFMQSDSPMFLKAFYIRRFFRIIPLYYAVLTIFVIGRFLFGGYDEDLLPIWAYFAFVNNFFEVGGWIYIFEFQFLWSLAIEEQFYLVGAFVAVAFGRRGIILLAILFVLASIGFRAYAFVFLTPAVDWSRFTFGHADPIGIGLLAAAAVTNSRATEFLRINAASVRTIGAFAFLVFLAISQIPVARKLGLDVPTISIVTACWIILKFVSHPNSVLTFAPLRRIGEMSFSLYIIHGGWLIYANWFLGSPASFTTLHLAINFALLLAVSRLIWVYVETPLIRTGHRWRYDSDARDTAVRTN